MADEVLSEILGRVDTVAILHDYVKLRQTGRTFKGLCPFHAEKTPSFHVNPEKGLWYCFGCGVGGNLFQFLMKINNVSFGEAKEFLAEKAGIALHAESDAHRSRRRRLYDVLKAASAFYRETLKRSKIGEEGLQYLDSRGIHPKTIEKFQIGMAPASGQELFHALSRQKFEVEAMREAGLVTKSNPPRDYFSRRILFPIWDSQGNVVAFGGRTVANEQPKYLNSPESVLFKKGEILYAFHLAKDSLIKEDVAILAEGYLDVVALHQFHFENAVATLGTSLTPQHAKFLHRFVPKMILSYDGDRAGQEAMRRAMAIMEGTGLDLEFLSFPTGEDPDSYLRKNGSEAFKRLLQNALSPVDFVSAMAKRDYDPATPEGKKKIVDEVLPILKAVHEPVLKDAYIKKIAQSLDISESVIRRQAKGHPSPKSAPVESSMSRENELLKWMLWEPAAVETVWSRLTPEDFESKAAQEGAQLLFQSWQERKNSFAESDTSSEATMAFLSSLSMSPPVGTMDSLEGLIVAQKARHLKRQLKVLKEDVSRRLKAGELNSTDEAAYSKYLALLRESKHQGAGT